MMEVLEKYIDIGVSIFAYVVSTALTVTLLVVASTPIINQTGDKTFIESTGVQTYHEAELYGHDILMTLLNVDPMAPYPKAIKINNTPVIKLTNEFISQKMNNVAVIYSANGDYKLSTMLDYKVISKEYVYKGTDAPYIHYVLKEVD